MSPADGAEHSTAAVSVTLVEADTVGIGGPSVPTAQESVTAPQHRQMGDGILGREGLFVENTEVRPIWPTLPTLARDRVQSRFRPAKASASKPESTRGPCRRLGDAYHHNHRHGR